jgi:hypothetical protein
MMGGKKSRWDEIFRTGLDKPWGSHSLLYKGYRVFSGGKAARGVLLATLPLLAQRSRMSKAIPLIPL